MNTLLSSHDTLLFNTIGVVSSYVYFIYGAQTFHFNMACKHFILKLVLLVTVFLSYH